MSNASHALMVYRQIQSHGTSMRQVSSCSHQATAVVNSDSLPPSHTHTQKVNQSMSFLLKYWQYLLHVRKVINYYNIDITLSYLSYSYVHFYYTADKAEWHICWFFIPHCDAMCVRRGTIRNNKSYSEYTFKKETLLNTPISVTIQMFCFWVFFFLHFYVNQNKPEKKKSLTYQILK